MRFRYPSVIHLVRVHPLAELRWPLLITIFKSSASKPHQSYIQLIYDIPLMIYQLTQIKRQGNKRAQNILQEVESKVVVFNLHLDALLSEVKLPVLLRDDVWEKKKIKGFSKKLNSLKKETLVGLTGPVLAAFTILTTQTQLAFAEITPKIRKLSDGKPKTSSTGPWKGERNRLQTSGVRIKPVEMKLNGGDVATSYGTPAALGRLAHPIVDAIHSNNLQTSGTRIDDSSDFSFTPEQLGGVKILAEGNLDEILNILRQNNNYLGAGNLDVAYKNAQRKVQARVGRMISPRIVLVTKAVYAAATFGDTLIIDMLSLQSRPFLELEIEY